MIKIFNPNDTDFSSNGNLCIKPIKCIEHKLKSLNGWYLDCEIDIKYKNDIAKDYLVVIKSKSCVNPQAFRIADNIEYTQTKIIFKANHVSYDSINYFLVDVRPTKLNAIAALEYVNERTDKPSPFIMYSDIDSISTCYFIRKNLYEAFEVFEERYSGYFQFDNWNVYFKQDITINTNIILAYGQKLQGIHVYEDWTNVVTKLYPTGANGIMLDEIYLESDVQYNIPYTKTISFSSDLEYENQTDENLKKELREKSIAYLNDNKYPRISYEISSNVNQELDIGYKVMIKHPLVDLEIEVVEYEYDTNLENTTSLVFGNFIRNAKKKFDLIKESIAKQIEKTSNQDKIIKIQTNLINSLNKNGYVYIDDNEILILDCLPREKAKNIWRWGLGGLGFSSNGYEGSFETAITQDGKINANFISSGKINTNLIEGYEQLVSKVSDVQTTVEKIKTTTQTSEGGNHLYIDDALESNALEYKIEGKSEIKDNERTSISNPKIKVIGKNMFDLDTFFDGVVKVNCTASKIENGIRLSFSKNADAYIGNVVALNQILPEVNHKRCIKVQPGTKYTLQISSSPKCFLTQLNREYKAIHDFDVLPRSYEKLEFTFTTYEDTEYIYLRFGVQNQNLTEYDFTNIQFEQEDVATEYEQYRQTNINIDLKGNELASMGDLKDALQIINGQAVLTKNTETGETVDLGKIDIPLFKGINHISLVEDLATNTSVKFLCKTPFSDDYATRQEVKTTKKDLQTEIKQTADSIKLETSATYSTKEEVSEAKQGAIDSANSNTAEKLKEYSTTIEMNAAIEQRVSEESASINLEVAKKVNETEFTGANIILEINNDKSGAQINADRIILTANDILDLIAGNELNLSTKNISIVAENFSVDKNGNTNIQSGIIGGFNLSNRNLSSNITPKVDYTENDINLLRTFLMDQTTLTQEQINRLDANGDGKLNSVDFVIMRQTMNSNTASLKPGQFILNTNDSIRTLCFFDGDNNLKTMLGLTGIQTPNISADSISVSNISSGNIDSGRCVLTSSGNREIYFNKTFSSVPNVVLTPLTGTNGVIAPKIGEITTAYFTANIGGTNFGDNEFCWIAISN